MQERDIRDLIEQVRNGTATATVTLIPTWGSGNAGASNSHYLESHSIAYRTVMADLPTDGSVIEMTLGYNVKRSGSYAPDYLPDYQRLLPTFVLTKMPLVMQILFFGALLSAIKSTSSATLLAPSTSFVENILKNLRPGMTDKQQLFAMRVTIVVFAALVLAYAIAMEGTSIYELVSSAYQVTLVGAFVPLVMGLYWKRATTQGAILSIGAGLFVWIIFFPQISTLGEKFPGQLAGLHRDGHLLPASAAVLSLGNLPKLVRRRAARA